MHAINTQTPYGALLREMVLPTSGANANRFSMWYLHPFALLCHTCSVSLQWFNLVKNAVQGTTQIRLVLYFDGINPGNPLAPDPQKLLMAIYWCFADLPNWFLRRKDSWFCFSLARENKSLLLSMLFNSHSGAEVYFRPLALTVTFFLTHMRFPISGF